MGKITLPSLFSSLQESMLADTNLSSTLDHPSDKGNNTEACWREWFEKYLPKRYCADKATVIDSNGEMSDQIDIVLYDRQYSYLIFNQKDIKYVPAESVYAIFEIKQNLCKSNLAYAAEKAESVRKLYRTSTTIPYANGTYDPKKPQRIIAGLLTTKTDWKEPFGNTFRNNIKSLENDKQIDFGCSLLAGSFHYHYDTSLLRTSESNESLVWFFLELLKALREIGTVPAIDLNAYMKTLSTKEVNV